MPPSAAPTTPWNVSAPDAVAARSTLCIAKSDSSANSSTSPTPAPSPSRANTPGMPKMPAPSEMHASWKVAASALPSSNRPRTAGRSPVRPNCVAA